MRPFLTLGVAMCLQVLSLGLPSASLGWTQERSTLSQPMQLMADGQPIDTGLITDNAHAGPAVADVDGDGDLDLIVGDFSGRFSWFENTGKDPSPSYSRRGFLQGGDRAARVPIYCCIASSPRFADLNGDGIADLTSGSYDPGGVYLFRGIGSGRFEKMEKLSDTAGVLLVHHPREYASYRSSGNVIEQSASFGSWPTWVDWDGDGDLDLILGAFDGGLWRRLNVGDRTEPKFSPECIGLDCVDGPVKVNGHADPVAADWDGDGLWDLVVGAEDGGVVWYKNIGHANQPKSSSPQTLVNPSSASKFLEQVVQAGQSPRPGARAQICVTDYNDDGRLDLLVGDYSQVKWLRELSSKEQADYEINRQTLDECRARINELSASDENEVPRQGLLAELAEAQRIDSTYCREVRPASFVWLYLREELPSDSTSDRERSDASPQPSIIDQTPEDRPATNYPVEFTSRADRDPCNPDQLWLTIEIKIEEGWQVYAPGTLAELGTPMSMELKLPTGLQSSKWKQSLPEPDAKRPKLQVYRSKTTWKTTITRPENTDFPDSLSIEVALQACNDHLCLPPMVIRKSVLLSVE